MCVCVAMCGRSESVDRVRAQYIFHPVAGGLEQKMSESFRPATIGHRWFVETRLNLLLYNLVLHRVPHPVYSSHPDAPVSCIKVLSLIHGWVCVLKRYRLIRESALVTLR